MGSWLGGCLVLLAGGFLSLCPFRPVRACSPASPYVVAIIEDDTPECLIVEPSYSDIAGALEVYNECDQGLTLEGVVCEDCGDPLALWPGERDELVLDNRDLEGTTEQELVWSMGEQSGTLLTRVTYRDTSDACDFACTCRQQPPSWRGAALILLGLLAHRRRRR